MLNNTDNLNISTLSSDSDQPFNQSYFIINQLKCTKQYQQQQHHYLSSNSSNNYIYIVLLSILLCLSQISTSLAQTQAIDISDKFSISDFQCIQNASVDYVIIGCWMGTGHPNPTCTGNIQAAISSRISSIDVYLEPCFTCGQPVYQASQMVHFISTFPVNINVAWLDIDIVDNWGNNTLENRVFYEQLSQTITNSGVQVGIFSSNESWSSIMGLAYWGGSSFPLWYNHANSSANFNDFQAFSGWIQPSLKRYQTTTICNLASMNLDYTNQQGI